MIMRQFTTRPNRCDSPARRVRSWAIARFLGLLLSVWVLAGCQYNLRDNLAPPGTIWQQRNRAVQFDPYPIDHMGPPIVGGRPREFSKPLPEAFDNQLRGR